MVRPRNARNGARASGLRRWYWSLQSALRDALSAVRRNHRPVRDLTGKGVFRQVVDIARLAAGPGKLRAEDYYRYRLYDDELFDRTERRRFAGASVEAELHRKLDTERWYVVANDKLLFGAILAQLGFEVPRLHAIYHPFRTFGDVRALRSVEDVKAYLRSDVPLPFVTKPIYGVFGRGVHAVQSRDPDGQNLVLTINRTIGIDTLAETLIDPWQQGFLFQELLQPHPEIARRCGPRLSCVRIIVAVGRTGPRIWRTLWRIASPANMADNYDQKGNFIAPVDPGTGRVGVVISGDGTGYREYSHHPETGAELSSWTLPDWPAARSECLRGAATIPGLLLQAWDVALTDRGPVLLELNPVGGIRSPQLAYRRGVLEDTGGIEALLEEWKLS